MNVNKNLSYDLVSGLSLFILISLPSIKLVYSSSILNILPLFGFLLCFYIDRYSVNKYKVKQLKSWFLFSFILCISFIFNLLNLTINFVNFIYFIVVVSLAVCSFSVRGIKIFVLLVLAWGLLLGLWQYLFGIRYDKSLGQTYLTVAMPLGGILTFGLIAITTSIRNIKYLMLAFLTIIVSVLALGSLLSRAAIILPVFIFTMHTIFILIASKIDAWKKFIFCVFIFLVVFFVYAHFGDIDFKQLYRIESLIYDIKDEPRIRVYSTALDLISNSFLFGYGTGSSSYYFSGTYPHNIFLDVFINGGFVLFLPFVFVIRPFFNRFILYYKFEGYESLYNTMLVSFGLFYFFQWNISWGLDTFYIPLVIMLSYVYYFDYTRTD